MQFRIRKSCIVITYILKSLCRPEYQVSQPCESRNLFSMYALLSKKLVEESKRYQYLKTEVKQSNSILLYCSEIWGCYLPKSADFNFMFDYSRLSSVLPCAG
jgi:hypothetical protein